MKLRNVIKTIFITAFLAIWINSACFAAGTWSSPVFVKNPYNPTMATLAISFVATAGGAADISLPDCIGWWGYSVEIDPGAPAPTTGVWDVKLLNSLSFDTWRGAAENLSGTANAVIIPSGEFVPFNEAPTLDVSNAGAGGAGAIKINLSK